MRTNCKTFALRARARCVCWRENRYSVLVMMSLQRKTVEAFQLLEVEQLPAEWIADNWEQNFCESIVLPTQVLGIDIILYQCRVYAHCLCMC